ncbi:hypothetical protein [Aeromicrobium chenweiae]|uniref:hypothetical protein n=1 Tax=Aeromicrobium chenweiae TaxID=2079793 RepID=UPI001092664F|nr:hypothetical protein [Aeromicrobium chenweiae]TGN32083.1 hypothetical protein E4L97_10205 [Aeromicrobium chenweiae]
MTGFQHSIPLGRADVKLNAQQREACERAERGHLLSEAQRGALQAASVYANPADARRAQAALDDEGNRNGRRER